MGNRVTAWWVFSSRAFNYGSNINFCLDFIADIFNRLELFGDDQMKTNIMELLDMLDLLTFSEFVDNGKIIVDLNELETVIIDMPNDKSYKLVLIPLKEDE